MKVESESNVQEQYKEYVKQVEYNNQNTWRYWVEKTLVVINKKFSNGGASLASVLEIKPENFELVATHTKSMKGYDMISLLPHLVLL
jgi:hypothetical protein